MFEIVRSHFLSRNLFVRSFETKQGSLLLFNGIFNTNRLYRAIKPNKVETSVWIEHVYME